MPEARDNGPETRGGVYIVLNKRAGSYEADAFENTVDRVLSSAGRPYHIHALTGKESLDQLLQEARREGYTTIVAAGGDGTVASVVATLANTKVPLCILPIGTGNVFARELSIPMDLEQALRLATEGYRLHAVDAMRVGDRHFVLNVGVGLSPDIMRSTPDDQKRRFGRLAYVWVGIKRLLGLRRQRYVLTIDGHAHRVRASEISILNAGGIGGATFRWAPEITVGDERLQVCVVRALTLWGYLRIAWDLLWSQQRKTSDVRCLVARERVRIEADRPLPVQGDGEIIGETPLEVRLTPSAVYVMVPEAAEVAGENAANERRASLSARAE